MIPVLNGAPRASLSALLLIGIGGNAWAGACPTRSTWPTQDWQSTAAATALARPDAVAALETFAFTLQGTDAQRLGPRTDGLVVIHNGSIVYERYARGFTGAMPHLSWSVSKSVVNALVGIGVARGALSLGDSICKYVTPHNPAACAITVQNLLEFSSGFAWDELYENESNQASSVLAMLYGEGHKDMVSFVSGHALRAAPGTTYDYSSGDATLLAGVIQAALAPSLGEDFPWTQLFTPIGMTSAVWERDHRGVLVGASYLYATPRDLAKFGFLFLNDGCWDGQRLLPEGWVQSSTQVSQPYLTKPLETAVGDVQGRQWWLNQPVPSLNIATPWPDVPTDAYAAEGHWGQLVAVIPSLDLVVVRTADDRDPALGSADFHDQLLKLAIGLVR